jgi:4-hydroxybenzoate polyprenyltransferase
MTNMTDTPDIPRRSKLAAWAQLLRLPNLLTVPGDPIAGYLIAAEALGQDIRGPALILAAGVSLLLYAFGLVLNDLADTRTDAQQRPDRPIPAGEVSRSAAAIGMVLLAVAGLGLPATLLDPTAPATLVAAALALAIVAYNLLFKRLALLGPLAMGTCRALSFLLGSIWAGWHFSATWQVLLPAGVLLAYIVALTLLAVGETRRHRPGLRAWGPFLVLTPALIAMVTIAFRRFGAASLPPWLCVYLLAWGLTRSAYFAAAVNKHPHPERTQAAVGHLLRGLLMIQAAVALALASEPAGLIVFLAAFVTLPLANVLSRRFYAS